jgi:predicted dehydrogenase/GNAT superfamily N-acetyltransferase
MSAEKQLKIGAVGSAGRGGTLGAALAACGAKIQAVCDTREDTLDASMKRLGAAGKYADFDEMLKHADLDAVVLGTPMDLHVPQAIAALDRGLHVLCEVPAGVSVAQCRELTVAATKSKAVYMMAENYAYDRTNLLILALARKGLFGEVYYAEGEYIHELKDLNEQTPWRRRWQTGVDGVTYGTHSLGPILQWMGGDRVTRVCGAGSGHHYLDPRGAQYENEDSCLMLCKTAKGALVKIRVDMLSDRPHAMNTHQLQGTLGAYESSRGGPGDRSKIWLKSLSEKMEWLDLESAAEQGPLHQHVDGSWREDAERAAAYGHGGGDYFVAADFLRACRGEIACPIGIHEAMDMTLPGLVSQASILAGGAWQGVPDSRQWAQGLPRPQLQMLWPKRLLAAPPPVVVPDDYEMRQYTPADEANYIELMAKAGFTGWTSQMVASTVRGILPGGFFLIVHRATGRLVATAMATHNPTSEHPYGGELGWVAGDPEHKGKGLGLAVCAAVLRRYIQAGYQEIYLRTDDFRLPALKTYLRQGWEPLYFCEGMKERWAEVFAKIGWKA